MINAAEFPGPALWQGLMLLAVSAWGLYVSQPDCRHRALATELLCTFGLFAAGAIILLIP